MSQETWVERGMGEGKEEVRLTTVPMLKSQDLSQASRVHTAGSVHCSECPGSQWSPSHLDGFRLTIVVGSEMRFWVHDNCR